MIISFLVCTFACTKTTDISEDKYAKPGEEVIFNFTTSNLEGENDTKVNGFDFEEGDIVGIYAMERDDNDPNVNVINNVKLAAAYARNIPYKYTHDKWVALKYDRTNNKLIEGEGIYFPNNDKSLNFLAYFPYDHTQDDLKEFHNLSYNFSNSENGNIDQSDIETFSKSNLLWTTETSGTKYKSISLSFKHLTAMVNFQITGTGINHDAIKGVYLRNTPNKCFFDLCCGEITLDGTSSEVSTTMYMMKLANSMPGLSTFMASVIPSSFTKNESMFVMHISEGGEDSYLATNKVTSENIFKSNNSYTYVIDTKVPVREIDIKKIKELFKNGVDSKYRTYKVFDGGLICGEVCLEYIKPTTYREGSPQIEPQCMVTFYPMMYDGSDINHNGGIVLWSNDIEESQRKYMGNVSFSLYKGDVICEYGEPKLTTMPDKIYLYKDLTVSEVKPTGQIITPTRFMPYLVNDNDGNEYSVTKILFYHLTTQNYRSTKMKGGNPLINISNINDWKNNDDSKPNVVTKEAYTYFDINGFVASPTTEQILKNGYQYNRKAISTLEVPKGWKHITDISTLVAFKDYATNPKDWISKNYGGTGRLGTDLTLQPIVKAVGYPESSEINKTTYAYSGYHITTPEGVLDSFFGIYFLASDFNALAPDPIRNTQRNHSGDAGYVRFVKPPYFMNFL